MTDQRYLDIFMEPLRVCRAYKPKFGTSDEDTTLDDFRRLYGADPISVYLRIVFFKPPRYAVCI